MTLSDHFPAYPDDLIREIVTVSHFDVDRLRQLLAPRPHLVKAAWDWGFGDWETPLGAACHMGRADIAEFLLNLGATPNLFSAILLADIATVRKTLEKYPGLARITGPHSISLLAHARMAGKPSNQILAYLESRGDCDIEKPLPLTARDKTAICGEYRFGEGSSQMVSVTDDMTPYLHTPMYSFPPQLNWSRTGSMSRPLFHTGRQIFYPAGAPSIRVTFEKSERDVIMNITDGATSIRASRTWN